MNKNISTRLVATALASLLITTGVFASPTTDTMNMMKKATVAKGVMVKMDGMTKEIMDESGAALYPLMYMDSVYLPVRGVSDVMGVKVDWDSASRSVMVNTMMQDDMMQDGMMQDDMKKDDMKKDNMMQDHAKKDDMMQDDMKKDSMMQDDAKKGSMMQDDAKKDNMMQDDAKKDNMMQDDMMNMAADVVIAKDIKIKLNGDTKEMKDAKGMTLYPILYNNRVYLPVRGISDILGVKIDWDKTSNSVMLGDMMKQNKQ